MSLPTVSLPSTNIDPYLKRHLQRHSRRYLQLLLCCYLVPIWNHVWCLLPDADLQLQFPVEAPGSICSVRHCCNYKQTTSQHQSCVMLSGAAPMWATFTSLVPSPSPKVVSNSCNSPICCSTCCKSQTVIEGQSI